MIEETAAAAVFSTDNVERYASRVDAMAPLMEPVGGGVNELRFFFGAGYRVYFAEGIEYRDQRYAR